MTHMHQLTALVGIPYEELGRTHEAADCWGLCLMAGRELFDLVLPEYFYTREQLLHDACTLIRRETAGPHWLRVDAPYPLGAIHIFRIAGHETHCGIDVGGGYFLHTMEGRNSCLEELRDANWVHRLVGSYEWAS